METRHFIKTLCKQKVKTFFLSTLIALKPKWVPRLRGHRTQMGLILPLGRQSKHLSLIARQLPMKTGWQDASFTLRNLAEAISTCRKFYGRFRKGY